MLSASRFADHVVLITGGSRGIGRVIARMFAAERAAVALLSTKQEAGAVVAAEIVSSGGRAVALSADVSREDDVRRAFEQAEQALGPVDILVNNAGIAGPTAPATHVSPADFERVLQVDLLGPFICARQVLPRMIERAAAAGSAGQASARNFAILNIGSIAGKISYPQRTPYASAKWGLIGLTLSLAEEVGPHGIRVNCICPGPVEGELIQQVIAARAKAMDVPLEQVHKKMISLTMLRRMVKPEDVAAMVLFLASDAGRSITGQAIDVTGGLAQFPQ